MLTALITSLFVTALAVRQQRNSTGDSRAGKSNVPSEVGSLRNSWVNLGNAKEIEMRGIYCAPCSLHRLLAQTPLRGLAMVLKGQENGNSGSVGLGKRGATDLRTSATGMLAKSGGRLSGLYEPRRGSLRLLSSLLVRTRPTCACPMKPSRHREGTSIDSQAEADQDLLLPMVDLCRKEPVRLPVSSFCDFDHI